MACFRLLQLKQPSYYSLTNPAFLTPRRPITRHPPIPEIRPGTSSSEARSQTAGSKRQDWRPWFVLAALLGMLIGVVLMYRPAPTQLDEAVMLVKANRHAAALPVLEEIARKQPEDADVFPPLAECYLRTDRLAEGRTALDTALKLKVAGAKTAPVVIAYADYYETKDDFAEAERLFASADASVPQKDLAPGKAILYQRWAENNAGKGQTDQALEHLKLAYELLPQSDPARESLPHKIGEYYRELAAVAETEQSNEAKAIALLKDSLKWADEPATRMALGSLQLRANNTTEAIDNYKVVCDQDPNNLEARHHLVDLYVQMHNVAGAQQALLELTEKERSVENFEFLATLSLQLRNYAAAVRALEDAIVLHPKDIPLLTKLHGTLVSWTDDLSKQGKSDEAMSAKGHADRVAELLKSLQGGDDKANGGDKGLPLPGNPPFSVVASRIWLAKGSFTPEGEIRFKNISGADLTDLSFSVMFFDNTLRRKNGSVTINAANEGHPIPPGAVRSAYFSCPNIVKSEHQLAVIVLWKGRFLKELPVVKER
jgi:lipopolysaccharide biosynthesis regulator YciM